jgi:hypothetical protein
MLDCALQPVNLADRENGFQIFGSPIGFRRRADAVIQCAGRLVTPQLAAGFYQRLDDIGQMPGRRILALTTISRAITGSAAPST